MKSTTNKVNAAAVFLVSAFLATSAQANFIEQILNNPRVQALLGKPTEIMSQSKQCAAPTFR